MRSSSYLSDHQQYRPPRQPEPHHGIDTVVEDISPAAVSPHRGSPTARPIMPFNGIPSEDNPDDSGQRLGRQGSPLTAATGQEAAPAALFDSNESLPANMAPTTNMDAFPLEPPTHESEQLDHLYGSYISPLCITSFLHLMSTFPQPQGAEPPHSSHRCLDNSDNPRVVELTLTPAPRQTDLVWRRHPRLVVFDMDSTLITQEERVALLKGVDAAVFEDLRPVLDVTKGVRQLIKALRRLGVKTAVLSGGFQPLTSWLAGELGIDYAHANEVVIADGKLTGETRGTIVGKERKRDLLVEIAAKEGIDLAQVVAVGDGANDLLMLEKAGLGVAWNAAAGADGGGRTAQRREPAGSAVPVWLHERGG
ncbi:hypothetical protein ACCO45_002063 [Purpureocillium lilacinum]|uniref:Uncharacterized protein n=1 Tax=Purpureocillium lilacinum TaxID=33203 RepID=A0ACC4E8U2_PURLI